MTITSILPLSRPLSIAQDLTLANIVGVDFSLYDLFAAASRAGSPLVTSRTITGCRIQGPGILLAGNGVTFSDCNFGDSRGDIRNLLVRPMGDKAIGTVPMRDCAFIGCEFYGVGFTGPVDFLEQMARVTSTPGAGA